MTNPSRRVRPYYYKREDVKLTTVKLADVELTTAELAACQSVMPPLGNCHYGRCHCHSGRCRIDFVGMNCKLAPKELETCGDSSSGGKPPVGGDPRSEYHRQGVEPPPIRGATFGGPATPSTVWTRLVHNLAPVKDRKIGFFWTRPHAGGGEFYIHIFNKYIYIYRGKFGKKREVLTKKPSNWTKCFGTCVLTC